MNTSFTSIATFKKFYNILIHWLFHTKLESLCSHRFWVGSKSPFGKLKGENQMFGSIYGAVHEWQRKKSLLWYVVISTLKFNRVFKVTASWAMHSFRMETTAIYRQLVDLIFTNSFWQFLHSSKFGPNLSDQNPENIMTWKAVIQSINFVIPTRCLESLFNIHC